MHEGYLFKMGKICIPLRSLWELLIWKAHVGGHSSHFGEKKMMWTLAEFNGIHEPKIYLIQVCWK
jgi:hypothetical protein